MFGRQEVAHTFETELGWMAILGGPQGLVQLTFGFNTPIKAIAALHLEGPINVSDKSHPLGKRLQRFAVGKVDDFLDVEIDYGSCGKFTQRVLEECRRIPSGETISYRELAARTGSPLAARAVGQVMAHNRIPLIIPCHRVIASTGGLGGYSARRGPALKRQLLKMEASSAV